MRELHDDNNVGDTNADNAEHQVDVDGHSTTEHEVQWTHMNVLQSYLQLKLEGLI